MWENIGPPPRQHKKDLAHVMVNIVLGTRGHFAHILISHQDMNTGGSSVAGVRLVLMTV